MQQCGECPLGHEAELRLEGESGALIHKKLKSTWPQISLHNTCSNYRFLRKWQTRRSIFPLVSSKSFVSVEQNELGTHWTNFSRASRHREICLENKVEVYILGINYNYGFYCTFKLLHYSNSNTIPQHALLTAGASGTVQSNTATKFQVFPGEKASPHLHVAVQNELGQPVVSAVRKSLCVSPTKVMLDAFVDRLW